MNQTAPLSGDRGKVTRHEQRYKTHVLAEIKKYKWLPFFSTYSGVVMDINTSGLKVAFSGEIDVKPHTLYTIRIPLTPLGLKEPRVFECRFEVKWFDTRNYRLGGLFVNLSDQQRSQLAQIVSAVVQVAEKRSTKTSGRATPPKKAKSPA